MLFGSFWNFLRHNRARPAPARRRSRSALGFQTLEDRLTPTTTISVTTFADLNGPTPLNPPIPALPGPSISLRQAIDQVNFGPDTDYVVQLPAGLYGITLPGAGEDANQTGDFDVRPLNATNVTFVGQGAVPAATVIDANGLDRVFHLRPRTNDFLNVAYRNLTITGGAEAISMTSGGGIYFGDDNTAIGATELLLDNAVVTLNQTDTNGAGIYTHNADVFVTNNSLVSFNVAQQDGGGIYTQNGDVLVSASQVVNNVAGDDGGGIYSGGGSPPPTPIQAANITITSAGGVASHVDNNAAGDHGGGVWDSNDAGILNILGSTVNHNLAGGTGRGGGLYVRDHVIQIVSSQINDNQAGSHGGGLDMYASGGNALTIIDTSMSNNKAGGDGGALYNVGSRTVQISGPNFLSVFNNNVAGGNWGAIADLAATTFGVSDTTFDNNRAALHGGAVHLANSAVGATFTAVTFSGNVAGGSGGGLHVPAGIRLDLVDSAFLGNTAGTSGGGALANSAVVNVERMSFVNNHATAGPGGGLENGSGATTLLLIANSTFSVNQAGTHGGGVHALAQVATLGTNQFGQNQAGGDGGGIQYSGKNLGLSNSGLSGNVAAGAGGGLAVSFTDPLATASVLATGVTGNSAGADGGGIKIAFTGTVSMTDGGTFTLNTSRVLNNSAATSGGGVITNAVKNAITYSTFTGNAASTGGGGIHFQDNGQAGPAQKMTVANSLLNSNSAGGAGNGGAILARANGNSLLQLTNSTLDNNSAGNHGGGLSSEGTTRSEALYATITRNRAVRGGGIFNGSAAFSVSLGNTTVSTNTSGAGNFNINPNVVSALQAFNGMDLNGAYTDFFPSLGVAGQLIGRNVIGIGNGFTGIFDVINGNKIGSYSRAINPLLGPLQNNGGPTLTRAPLVGSPLLKSGFANFTVFAAAFTDQRGTPVGTPALLNFRPLTNLLVGMHPTVGAYQSP